MPTAMRQHRRLERLCTHICATEGEGEFHSVEQILEEHLPPKELAQVKSVLYGLNTGKAVAPLAIPFKALEIATHGNFDVQMYQFNAHAEIRDPRRVKIAVTQNMIVEPTDAPIQQQYLALQLKHEQFVEAAAAAGCNIICFQEAWTMPFAFCTREKLPWTGFAEDAKTGPSTQFCQRMAKKHNMVIVSPILERDMDHGTDTLIHTQKTK